MIGDPPSHRIIDDPANLLRMAHALIDSGAGDKASDLIDQALAAHPGDPAIAQIAATLLERSLPPYHLAMLRDRPRNDAYRAAIERAAASADGVLDIGTGSGLLAMIAARAGARRVVACEANDLLAAAARTIIAANGLEGQVELVARHSTALDAEADLGGRVGLIVTETFGPRLLDENVLPTLDDALERLALPGVKVIPAAASIEVALARFDRAAKPPIDAVCGFDLSAMNRHAGRNALIKVDDPRLALASAPQSLFRFDLAARDHAQLGRCEMVSTGGRIDGVVQWLRLELDPQHSYENRPGTGQSSHWAAGWWPLDRSIETATGDRFSIHGWNDRRNLVIWATAG